MMQTIPRLVTFDQFVAWYPTQIGTHYELHNGEIVEMPKPPGKHSRVAGFINGLLFLEITRLKLPYFLPKECIIKPIQGESGYEPDVIVLDEVTIDENPRWEQESILTQGRSIKLVVEVASTNWSDDYALKLEDYEAMGIQEYWIVDYLGIGGIRFIGKPKRPTLTIYHLVDGAYQMQQFRGEDRLQSPTFPDLHITADSIFAAK
jgi:Uma2 family endonuclease